MARGRRTVRRRRHIRMGYCARSFCTSAVGHVMASRIKPTEWQDALDAIPLAIASAGLSPDEPAAAIAHDMAVDVLLSLRRRYDRRRGTIRQFAFRSMCRAARWATSPRRTTCVNTERRTIFDEILESDGDAAYLLNLKKLGSAKVAAVNEHHSRFTTEELNRLPKPERRAVILYVHLGLSLRDTGLLLGGISHTRVRSRLHRAAIALGLAEEASFRAFARRQRQRRP